MNPLIRRLLLGLLGLMLLGCSADRRQTREYLQTVQKDVQPALDQARVVGELTDNLRPGNLKAGWPVVKKNLEELHQKTSAAQARLQSLPVPAPAAEVHRLLQEELTVVEEMSSKALSLGEKASDLGTGLPALRKLARLKPEVDQVKELQFRHVELSTKLKASMQELRRQQKL